MKVAEADGCNTSVRGIPRSASAAALAVSTTALVADITSSGRVVRTEATAASRTTTTVVPFFVKDHFEDQHVEVVDVWALSFKEFIFSVGCSVSLFSAPDRR